MKRFTFAAILLSLFTINGFSQDHNANQEFQISENILIIKEQDLKDLILDIISEVNERPLGPIDSTFRVNPGGLVDDKIKERTIEIHSIPNLLDHLYQSGVLYFKKSKGGTICG